MIASKAATASLSAVPPVARESTVLAPPALGAIPPQLDGTLLTVGPNPLGGPDGRHPFAGDGMVHGLRLRDGRAEWYRNRWLRTDRAARLLGELPAPGPRRGFSDNANGNIIRHAGRTLVLGDGGPLPLELDRELNTAARVDFDGTLPAGFAAHPQHDPLTGELHAIATSHEPPHAVHVVVDVHGRVRRTVPIQLKRPTLMHAFSLTEHYALLYDLPVVLDPAAGPRAPYAWDDGHGARLGLLPREGGPDDILWVELAPCFVFHPVNAYETDRGLVVDVVRHPRVFDNDRLRPGETCPTLWRWTVHPASGTVVEEQLCDRVQEAPRIDDRYRGSAHRLAFTTALAPGTGELLGGPSLLRHDFAAGRTEAHHLPPGRTTGEPVFVPREPCAPEGDGWLLSFAHDRRTDRSELRIVDTADFTGGPVAVVELPVRVPHGFHTTWAAGA
ncbi:MULTISPECIES: carotenoid oxygenase family protein [unclassified Streptomyces]|uniref:carotenoid oxygenase family protein n=1 Tax=unclassified Streptomyces TaxID=2593676 RepID=UPI00081EE41F|nr:MULTISPECIES: carotenoid oxygenase family protein [unclassified Streptomyces]MYR28774.1 dioxygenase [Streptomyces sp. SID4945]SCD58109.1 carotenoid cleavage dioxygenase [Streptomyces sp. TverLS-915]SCF41140.1 carotenoid cleavage dioxygenase [Streptomyces sp. LcepLS]